MSTPAFKSQPLSGHRLCLPFERVGDTYWTDAEQLRAIVAELNRLGVPDDADVRLQYWPDHDNPTLRAGWSLNMHVGADTEVTT